MWYFIESSLYYENISVQFYFMLYTQSEIFTTVTIDIAHKYCRILRAWDKSRLVTRECKNFRCPGILDTEAMPSTSELFRAFYKNDELFKEVMLCAIAALSVVTSINFKYSRVLAKRERGAHFANRTKQSRVFFALLRVNFLKFELAKSSMSRLSGWLERSLNRIPDESQ